MFLKTFRLLRSMEHCGLSCPGVPRDHGPAGASFLEKGLRCQILRRTFLDNWSIQICLADSCNNGFVLRRF